MSELDIYFQEMYAMSKAGNPRAFMSKQFSVAVEYGCTLKEINVMYSEWLKEIAPMYKEQGII